MQNLCLLRLVYFTGLVSPMSRLKNRPEFN